MPQKYLGRTQYKVRLTGEEWAQLEELAAQWGYWYDNKGSLQKLLLGLLDGRVRLSPGSDRK